MVKFYLPQTKSYKKKNPVLSQGKRRIDDEIPRMPEHQWAKENTIKYCSKFVYLIQQSLLCNSLLANFHIHKIKTKQCMIRNPMNFKSNRKQR